MRSNGIEWNGKSTERGKERGKVKEMGGEREKGGEGKEREDGSFVVDLLLLLLLLVHELVDETKTGRGRKGSVRLEEIGDLVEERRTEQKNDFMSPV